jgi:hypothetical protein
MYQLCGQPVRQLFVIDEDEKLAIIEESQGAPEIELSLVDLQWLQTLAEGWASPLSGFMRERQYLQCLHHGQIYDLKKKCTMPDDRVHVKKTAYDFGSASSSVANSEEEGDEDTYPLPEGPINQSVG